MGAFIWVGFVILCCLFWAGFLVAVFLWNPVVGALLAGAWVFHVLGLHYG